MPFRYMIETEDLCRILPLSSYGCRKIDVIRGRNTFMINKNTYHTLIIHAEFENQIDSQDMDYYNAMNGVSIKEIEPAAKIEDCA